MPDPRFFESLPAMTVGVLAERIGGEVVPDVRLHLCDSLDMLALTLATISSSSAY